MDSNNLINIDDLVRQRLGGAEERELPGAWSRMKDLLDEEDKRRPLGIIFWRRALTYTGIALLVAALTVGSYNTSVLDGFRGAGDNAASSSLTVASTATKSTTETDGKTASVSSNGPSITRKTTGNSNMPANSSPSHADGSNHNSQSSGNGTAITKKATDKVATTTPNETVTRKTKTRLAGNPTAVGKKEHKGAIRHRVSNNLVATATAETHPDNSSESHPNSGVALKESANTKKGATLITNVSQTAKGNNLESTRNTQQLAATEMQATPKKDNSDAKQELRTLSSTPKAISSPKKNGKLTTSNNASATAATITDPNETTTRITKQSTNDKPNGKKVGKQLANNSTSSALSTTGAVAKVTGKKKSTIVEHKAEPTATLPLPSSAAKVESNNPETTDETDSANPTGKKKAEKYLKVKNYYVRNSKAGNPTKQAAISRDTFFVSVDSEAIAANKATAATQQAEDAADEIATQERPNSKKKQSSSALKTLSGTVSHLAKGTSNSKLAIDNRKPTGSKTAEKGHASAEETTVAAARKGIALNKLVRNNTFPMLNAKIAAVALPEFPVAQVKKKSKSHFWEDMSDKLNEIKMNLSGARFTPGLTAGINSTFFGPSSFRGFQFGVTGTFEMDDHWSFFGELKYFHRMNSNFSMQDKYLSPTGDSLINTFNFSTLHSFEMPWSIRYTRNKMTFEAGMNVLYTTGVNTGAAPIRYTTAINSPGAFSPAPTLAESDFAGRFGFGYLFGCSYQVAPNVNLNLRTVQTFWDNAQSSGARTVSSQLYKSPTLQVSVQYRFGRNKSE
jgi:hypothetical protein